MNQVDNELVQVQVVTFVQDQKRHYITRRKCLFILHQVLMIDKHQVRHLIQSLMLTYVRPLEHLHHKLLIQLKQLI